MFYCPNNIEFVVEENTESMVSIPIYNPAGGEEETSIKEEGLASRSSVVTQTSLLQNLQATKLEEPAAPQPPKMSFEVIKGYHY